MKTTSFATLSIALLSALLLVGCDTSARISFQDPNFNGVHSAGVTHRDSDNPGSSTDLANQFVLFDNEGGVVVPGSIVGRARIEPSNIKVGFGNNGEFQRYTDTAGCNTASCTGTLSCAGDACVASAQGLSSGTKPPTFLSHTDSDKVIGVLVQSSASIRGQLPNSYRMGQFCKPGGCSGTSPDQGVVREDQLTPSQQLSLDDSGGLAGTISSLFEVTKRLAFQVSDTFEKQTYIGAYFFNSKNSVVPLVKQQGTSLLPGNRATTLSAPLSGRVAGDYKGLNNVFDAIVGVLPADPSTATIPVLTSKESAKDKILIVVVGGPDESRTDPLAAIDAAKAAGVRVFVVHYDLRLQESEKGQQYKYYPDLPPYYTPALNQNHHCSSDSDCYAYERCAEPQLFTAGGRQPIGGTAAGKLCLVKRNELGQTGPIDTYAQIAAETEGGYIYIPRAPFEVEESLVTWLPWASVGLWKVDLSAPTLPVSRYQLTGSMSVSLSNVKDPQNGGAPEQTVSFSPKAGNAISAISPAFVVSENLACKQKYGTTCPPQP